MKFKNVQGSLFGISRLRRVMPTCDSKPEGRIFLSASNNHDGFFFLHTFALQSLILGITINELRSYTLTFAILKVAMTSTPNVLTTELRDLLYNQWIDNTCCCSFLAHLNRRLILVSLRIGRPPSYIVVVRRRPHALNVCFLKRFWSHDQDDRHAHIWQKL